AERLAPVHAQAHVLDRVDRPRRTREHALADGEVLGQVLDLDEGTVTCALLRRAHPVTPSSTPTRLRQISRLRSGVKWHASRWPPGIGGSGGRFVSHGSNRYWQRGWNGQPGGGRSSDGGEPSIGSSTSSRFSTVGIDSRRPHVYGCCAPLKISSATPYS